MKKSATLIAVLFLIGITTTAHATYRQNGSIHHNNINSNNTVVDKSIKTVVKNKNTNTNKNKNISVNKNKNTNKTNVKVNTDIDTSNRNKNTNKQGQLQGQLQGQAQKSTSDQKQTANNEGITVQDNSQDNSDNSDDSVYLAPPPTQSLEGTHSVQVTTPFGGAGYSKDAQYAILKIKMAEVDVAIDRGFITKEEGQKVGRKLWKKFIKANNNIPLF